MSTKTVKVEITGDPTSATRALTVVSETATKTANKSEDAMTKASSKIGGAFGKLDGLLGQFGVPFSGVLGELGNKLGEFESKGTSAFQKVAAAGKVATLALGVGAAAIGFESIHLADTFEESEARLKTALKGTWTPMKAAEEQIGKTNKFLENLGFNNIEAAGSMARLITATRDVTKSTMLMGLAADIARARHMSLESATDLLIKVEGGRYTLLGRTLGVSKEVVDGIKNQDDAIKILSDRYSGSARASADTFNGKMQVMRAKLEDVGIKIGTFLIPWIEKLVGAVQDSITWFEKHKTIAEALAITFGVVLVAALGAFTVSLFTAGGALAFLLTPIAAVVLAIAAVGAAAYLLWTNWDTVWNWIKDHPAIAVVVSILAAPVAAFVLIVGGLKMLYDNWDSIWGAIKSVTQTAWGFIKPIIDAIVEGIGFAVDAYNTLQDLFGGDSGAYNNPGGIRASGSTSVPEGATGGIVTRPTFALIGEAGPEAVVPLNRMPGALALPGGRGGGAVPSGVGGGVTWNVTINETANPRRTAIELQRQARARMALRAREIATAVISAGVYDVNPREADGRVRLEYLENTVPELGPNLTPLAVALIGELAFIAESTVHAYAAECDEPAGEAWHTILAALRVAWDEHPDGMA